MTILQSHQTIWFASAVA